MSLHTSKGRDAAQAFLVEGTRAIAQIVQNSPHRIVEIICQENMKAAVLPDFPFRRVSRAQFRSIALSQHPAGPIAVVSIPEAWKDPTLPAMPGRKILVLEDVQDPGNIGSLVRSAAAFDFSGLLLSEKCADPFGPKAVQASSGAIVSLWLRRTRRYRDLLWDLKQKGFRIFAADIRGTPWKGPSGAEKNLVIVLGNEGNGLSSETMDMADETVKIPFNGKKVESLNVAASGAVCMYLSTLLDGDPCASVPL